MIPIFEQGSGKGIGHSIDSFLRRFNEICKSHIAEKRAKAFALVLYDFTDNALRHILKDQGVFARLDRLSGRNLSLFYLHAGTQHSINKFNETLLSSLQINNQVTLPCVVFFRLSEDGNNFKDIAIAELDHADLVHGFHELYEVINRYVSGIDVEREDGFKFLVWIKGTVRFVSIEAFRAALQAAFGVLFRP